MAIIVDLDVMLAKRKMSVGELSEAIDISPSNIAVLKNGGARPVRYSALETICEVLDCQPVTYCAAQPRTEADNSTGRGYSGFSAPGFCPNRTRFSVADM